MASFIDNFPDAAIFSALGDDVTFTPSGGSPVAIKGEFTREYYETDSGTESTTPVVQCIMADVPNYKNGSIVHDGTTYQIIRGEPSGDGLIALILRL